MTSTSIVLPGIPNAAPNSPSWTLLGTEPFRAAYEYLNMQFMAQKGLPNGDGHPVVIFPGLATDHRLTAPLKIFCEKIGYAAYDWGKGVNTGPVGDGEAWLAELADHVHGLVSKHGRRMSLIGWSLGGIYAREIAKILHSEVRQVITLGTPFAGEPDQTNVARIFKLLNRNRAVVGDGLKSRLGRAPAVPTSSIYSRSDGIVAWQSCVQADACENAENIEVVGSHCGLCWNPEVLAIIADRLAQPDGAWRRHTAGARQARGRQQP